MALFGTASQIHQCVHSLQHCLQTFVVDAFAPSLPDRLMKRTLVCIFVWAAKGLNAVTIDPWVFSLLKHPWWDVLQQDTDEECLPTCSELWEAMESPIQQGAIRIRSLNWHVTGCQKLKTELRDPMQKKYITYLIYPLVFEGIQPKSSQKKQTFHGVITLTLVCEVANGSISS